MWEPGVRKEDTLGAIRVLVGRGADTEGTDSAGDAPLFEAVASGYVAAVRVLLECGADANAKDGEGGSVLHRAAGKGDVADVKVLLVFGADVGALVSVKGGVGRTPLEVYRECKRDYLAYLEQQGWDGGERIYGFGGGGGREMMRLLGGTAEELADSDGGMV